MIKELLLVAAVTFPAGMPTSEYEGFEQMIEDASQYENEERIMGGVIVTECFEIYEDITPTINPPASERLTKQGGVFYGASGKETYYNLDMTKCVEIMRGMGYDAESYPYWIRDDGVKMLGDYVMVAADFSIRPRGTILETSLGTAIVVDTGSFASYDSTMLDICVNW